MMCEGRRVFDFSETKNIIGIQKAHYIVEGNMEIEDKKGEGNVAYRIIYVEGDMGQTTQLNLILQADGDVVLALNDKETGQRLSIEFCTIGGGGGRNPIIIKGLQRIIADLIKEKG